MGRTLRASAVILVAAPLVAGHAGAADISYLAPPGVPAAEFPALQRPVAPIVSPTREVRRDSLDENGQIARILELNRYDSR